MSTTPDLVDRCRNQAQRHHRSLGSHAWLASGLNRTLGTSLLHRLVRTGESSNHVDVDAALESYKRLDE